MIGNKKYSTILILFFWGLISPTVYSQVNEDLTVQAIQLFENGKYQEAEPLLKTILLENPENTLMNYYYGACRTENNHFSNSDLESLIIANQDTEVPIKINYYFGIQYQARSNWERALKFYNKYNSIAKLEGEEKQNLLEKIQQCYDKINPFEEYFVQGNNETVIPITGVVTDSQSNLVDESDITTEDLLITNEVIPVQEDENIEFMVNSEISYSYLSHFKTEEGKSFFKQGSSKQEELEKSLIQLDELRDKYNKAKTSEEKKLLGQDILALENKTYSLKKESTEYLLQAKNLEYEYWLNASIEEINEFKHELDKIEETEISTVSKDTDLETDSAANISPEILLGNSQFVAPVEEKKQNDLIYKIQIGAYSKGLPSYIKRLYDKLSLIRKIENYTDENGIVVYTTGNLSNLEDAITMQNQVRQEGVEDAFVVPYFKGKRISLKEAKELESK